ncbi:helix-turn-helix domain-containing protein [Pontiella agarivorans]|uniref:Helix-turn-helix domain-containing protein n=1 Tax=Pontiella agarivorans TaxID=3038953 RepID=A0ABU5MXA2_9BACT|nr:helix-turn-helix domain-containing protein [Pontiella agarivorans]MDZ8118800.1 helix-turn-helix domain-containing protein [Pontiella agarivorans]
MSVMKSLQAEISRLARKEIKKELEPVKRVCAAQRGYIADLRREIAALEKEVSRLRKMTGAPEPVKVEESEKGFWISGKGVVSLRKKLALTQAELAQLAGVSAQSVVKWEKYEGKIPLRKKETAVRLQGIRGMSKTKARAELERE